MGDVALPLRRLLALRQFEVFSSVDLDELAFVAENLTDVTIPAGARLDPHPATLHFLVEGRLAPDATSAKRASDLDTAGWGPRERFGWLEILARRPPPPAVAVVESRSLALAAHDFFEVLEDSFGLLRAILRELAARLACTPAVAAPPLSAELRLPSGPLSLVERLIVLRRHLPFIGGNLQALSAIARAAEEVRWPAGTTIAREGEPAETASIVVAGTLREQRVLSSRGEGVSIDRIVGPGQAWGSLETLGGLRHPATIEASTDVRALVCSGATILDILEDHTDLGLGMIAAFAGALLDRPDRSEPARVLAGQHPDDHDDVQDDPEAGVGELHETQHERDQRRA
jgi:CRP-like cAMP-binding protein